MQYIKNKVGMQLRCLLMEWALGRMESLIGPYILNLVFLIFAHHVAHRFL